MQDLKYITGNSQEELWKTIEADFRLSPDLLEYATVLKQGIRTVYMELDIDLGGGFEGGYEYTRFTAPVSANQNFHFVIHKESFLDEIGKFLGMQDILVGHPEFDEDHIIKSNNEARVKIILDDKRVRHVLQSLTDFRFYTEESVDFEKLSHKGKVLILDIEEGINDPGRLRELYEVFYTVLQLADPL